MAPKQQNKDKPNISPVLFMALNGEPMTFFLRPGPVKRKLQPLITAGGGMLVNVQQPGAILLLDPEERIPFAESTAHWYVSTEYINDCIEKDEQLNLEDYRLNTEVVPRHSPRVKNNKETSPGLLRGRIAYTAEDDNAILSYVSKHKKELGGNLFWKEMEMAHVTSHSWQSMKHRYKTRLAKKHSEVVEVATTEKNSEAAEGETKMEGNQETDVEKPSSAEGVASPRGHSTESDLTQIDAQSIPAECTQPEIAETQTSICPQEEVQHVNSQTEKQAVESTKVETGEDETSNSPQSEGPCLDPPIDAHPIPAESTEPETVVSSQIEGVPEDSTPTQPKSKKKPDEKEKASPMPERSQRRSTRRQLQLEGSLSPEPYGKRLRSSLSSAEQPSSSPHPTKKTKSALKSALQKDTTVDQPPSKKARGKSVAAVVGSQQEESGQAPVSETTQADTESNSGPQKGKKRREKRTLGILELATKEFEDESESDEVQTPDLQNPTETVTMQPTSTEPPLPTPDTAAPTQSNPEPGPSLQENLEETQASSSNCLPPTTCPKPAAISAPSKAHLFIFDSESLEEDSQSLVGATAAPPNPQPTVNKDAAYPLTQVQLEEDKERITELMKESDQDLVSVTKALLKTSGDFSAALDLLLNPFSVSGPSWKRCDDSMLLSGDRVIRQQLQDKYGEEEVAKRIVFLEVEG